MNKRRAFLSSSALIPAAAALAGCAALGTSAGATAGIATATRIVAYVQSGVTALSAILVAFGPQMGADARQAAQAAVTDLGQAAASVGEQLSSNATALSTGAAVSRVSTLMTVAIGAIRVALSFIPGAAAALTILSDVEAVLPVLTALAGSLTNTPAPAAPPTAASRLPAARARLGVLTP